MGALGPRQGVTARWLGHLSRFSEPTLVGVTPDLSRVTPADPQVPTDHAGPGGSGLRGQASPRGSPRHLAPEQRWTAVWAPLPVCAPAPPPADMAAPGPFLHVTSGCDCPVPCTPQFSSRSLSPVSPEPGRALQPTPRARGLRAGMAVGRATLRPSSVCWEADEWAWLPKPHGQSF